MDLATENSLDLIFYHYQDFFYWFVFGLFFLRFWLNMMLYYDTDSHVYNPDVPDHWKYIPYSMKEREEKRKLYPRIKDFSKDGSFDIEALLLYAFTFWWPTEYLEEPKISKRKKMVNGIHVIFLILFISTVFLVFYMQEVNTKYSFERNWLYLYYRYWKN